MFSTWNLSLENTNYIKLKVQKQEFYVKAFVYLVEIQVTLSNSNIDSSLMKQTFLNVWMAWNNLLKTQLTPSQHDSLLQLNMKMSMLGFNFLWSMFSRVISWLIATYESVNLRQSMVACWWNMGYKTESFSGATCSIPLISHPCQRHSKGYASYFSYRQTLGWNEEK